MSIHEPKAEAPVNRRTLLKGVGLAAAATVLPGARPALAERAGAAVETPKGRARKGVLADVPVVMVWRQTSDLAQTRHFVGHTSRLQEVGKPSDAVFYDAGTVLLAYASGGTGRAPVGTSQPWPARYRVQPNPASKVVHLPLDFDTSLRRLSKGGPGRGVQREQRSSTASFVDQDGNHFCLHEPSSAVFGDAAARKLRRIVADGRSAVKRGGPVENPIGAIELSVTDLARASRFYSDVLGLRLLSREAEQATFDLGTVLLVLRPEPVGGLVALLQRSGRLLGDGQVFYVSDLERTLAGLEASGLEHAFGIEERAVGKVANISDPDGHLWVLWQLSGGVERTDYYPTLSRIAADGRRS